MKKYLRTYTESEPCPYFQDGRTSTYAFFQAKLSGMYSRKQEKFKLLERGFISAHDSAYTTMCTTCNECIPLRTNLDNYTPTKKNKRLINQNRDLSVSLYEKPVCTKELHDLMCSYMKSRHPEEDLKNYTSLDFQDMMLSTSHTLLIKDKDGKCIAACCIDVHKDSINIEQIFYDHDNYKQRSLGKFTKLKCLELAQYAGFSYAYEGAWAEGSPKIGHKHLFPGLEFFKDGQWSKDAPHAPKTTDENAIPVVNL